MKRFLSALLPLLFVAAAQAQGVSAVAMRQIDLREYPIPAGPSEPIPAGTSVTITDFRSGIASAYVGVSYGNRQGYMLAMHLRPASVAVGMKEDLVFNLYGMPLSRNRTTTAGGTNEQHVFRINGRDVYVYYENGIVTATQN